VRYAKVWIISNELLVELNRLVKLTVYGVSLSLLEAYDRRQRIKLTGPIAFIDRLLCPATDVRKCLGEPLVGGGIAGIELKDTSEFILSARIQ
jgi:hypothetical protein